MEMARRATVPWKAVALPAEHGGWGLLAEPVVLGLVSAPSAAGICLALARAVLAGHAAAVAVAAGLARADWAPWLAAAAFLVLLARAAWGLSSRRRPVRPQVLGFQELAYGLLTLALLAFGYRVGP